MSYFTETFNAILEKNDDYSFADGMRDSAQAMIPGIGTIAGNCFSTTKYLTYKDANGNEYKQMQAFTHAYMDYLNRAGGLMNRMKAGSELERKCKEANKKEEYNLNKILGL